MSTRSSGRAPKPPQRLITIEEGPQLASRSDRVGFAQLGEQRAREVESRGGEEPTDEEVDEVSVVPSGLTRGPPDDRAEAEEGKG